MRINININDCVIPKYRPVLKDILKHKHTHYVFKGGRGTTKSSFMGISIPLLIIQNPKCHAVCFRKVGNTVQRSVFAQVVWGIYQLGLQDLFAIPKNYATPIIYKPTGQQIICMGLDDPNKVKSIKLPFGYIGITWFEELDQYNGEEQLRTTTQSTMRGGDKFWDFRTFNPPISRNNWANQYADNVKDLDSTLVVHNSYFDVPVEWLGEQFIEDADELKLRNERAYRHEYLGEAIGTGGDVFPNVEDLDMYSMRNIVDGAGNTIMQMPMIQTFDRIYSGIDWGFAKDPFRFVKMHFDSARLDLYIFSEYSTIGDSARNAVLYDTLYKEKQLITGQELVTADSAEPKSIADFKAYGAYIRGAEKGPDSVRYGMRWLQTLNHIYIDKRHCPETYKEFIEYEYEQDKEGNFISSYPDCNNHSIDAVRYALERFYKRKGN